MVQSWFYSFNNASMFKQEWYLPLLVIILVLLNFQNIKSFLPPMLAKKHGHIVSINSILGEAGICGMADYAASKGALLRMEECLEMELYKNDQRNIHLTTIVPYVIKTGLMAGTKPRFDHLTIICSLSFCYITFQCFLFSIYIQLLCI